MLIADPVNAAGGTYNWTVPDAISTNIKVRVSDSNDSAVSDVSNGVFKIMGSFAVTAPNGGEAWVVAEAQNITWNTNGTVANVKLQYSIDAGTNWKLITSSVANAGSYAWTVPDDITALGRVKVSDAADAAAFDESNNNFKIRGDLTVTAPDGGEKWAVGSSQLITWNRVGSIANVRIDYSNDGGMVFIPVVTSAVNAGVYSWDPIPDAITTQALVKIRDASDLTVEDVSDASFKIQGSFKVTAPNGGQIWVVGEQHDITWTWNGSVPNVNLEYSTDAGSSYTAIATVANSGLYQNWVVPDAVSGQVRVKVADTNDAEAFDASDANLRIRCNFTLTAPNGGEIWKVGRTESITWLKVGTIANAKLEYSTADFFPGTEVVIDAAAPNTGSYAWTIPDDISNTVKARVSDPDYSGANDASNADFKIAAYFDVTVPDGGMKWDVDSTQNIMWNYAGSVAEVDLAYSVNGGLDYTGIARVTNNGAYSWMVADDISAQFRIRVSDPNDATVYNQSAANNKIKAKFTLNAPNGGEILTVNDTYDITWDCVGTVANVKLDYSLNNFFTSTAIAASTPNDGTCPWAVPDAISTSVKVRVMSTLDTDAYDESDGSFKIRGAFALTAPNGGEQWPVAQVSNITWNTTGTIGSVRILYSTNSGVSFPNTIVASTANAGTYAWNVPDSVTPSARVRVQDASDGTVYDDSNANFSIVGWFQVTGPNGGESLQVGSAQTIQWNWGATIPNVKLSYSTDSGASFDKVVTAQVANGAGGGGTHSFAWTVPDDASQTVRVRVEDYNNAAVNDTSDANFKIVVGFNVMAPNDGTERWVTNEKHDIQWVTTGTLPTVKLAYSIDGGLTYPHVIADAAPNAGPGATASYEWTIPDHNELKDHTVAGAFTAGGPLQARVKVSDPNDATVYDSSDANFTVDYYEIEWVIRDARSNVKLSGLSALSSFGWEFSDLAPQAPRGILMRAPYGHWEVTWSKVKYQEEVQGFDSDEDKEMSFFMETSAVHIWRAETTHAYTPDPDGAGPGTDKLEVTSWLEIDGKLNPMGGVFWDIKIYQGSSLVKKLTKNEESWELNIDPADPDGKPYAKPITQEADGLYHMTWGDGTDIDASDGIHIPEHGTGIEAGKSYTMITRIQIATGATTETPVPLDVSQASFIAERLDIPMSQVRQDVKGELAIQTQIIQTEMTKFTDSVDTSLKELDAGVNEIQRAGEDLTTTVLQTKNDLNAATATFQESVDSTKTELTTVIGEFRTDVRDTTSELTTVVTDTRDQMTTIVTETRADLTGISTEFRQTVADASTELTEVVTGARDDLKTAAEEVEAAGKKYAPELLLPVSVLVGDSLSIRYSSFEKLVPLVKVVTHDYITAVSYTPMAAATGEEGKEGMYEYVIPKIDAATYTPGKPLTVIVKCDITAGTTNIESGTVLVETASDKLLLPGTVTVGDKLEIRYRSTEGLSPMVKVLNYNNDVAIDESAMAETPEQPGLYEYVIPEISGDVFTPGKPLTVVVTDRSTANQQFGSVIVESTNLTNLQGMVAATMSMRGTMEDTLDAINVVRAEVSTGGAISDAINNLEGKVVKIGQEIEYSATAREESTLAMRGVVEEVKDSFESFVGEKGYTFKQLLDEGIEGSATIGDIKTRARNIHSATTLMREILERELLGDFTPFVMVTFE